MEGWRDGRFLSCGILWKNFYTIADYSSCSIHFHCIAVSSSMREGNGIGRPISYLLVGSASGRGSGMYSRLGRQAGRHDRIKNHHSYCYIIYTQRATSGRSRLPTSSEI